MKKRTQQNNYQQSMGFVFQSDQNDQIIDESEKFYDQYTSKYSVEKIIKRKQKTAE